MAYNKINNTEDFQQITNFAHLSVFNCKKIHSYNKLYLVRFSLSPADLGYQRIKLLEGNACSVPSYCLTWLPSLLGKRKDEGR